MLYGLKGPWYIWGWSDVWLLLGIAFVALASHKSSRNIACELFIVAWLAILTAFHGRFATLLMSLAYYGHHFNLPAPAKDLVHVSEVALYRLVIQTLLLPFGISFVALFVRVTMRFNEIRKFRWQCYTILALVLISIVSAYVFFNIATVNIPFYWVYPAETKLP